MPRPHPAGCCTSGVLGDANLLEAVRDLHDGGLRFGEGCLDGLLVLTFDCGDVSRSHLDLGREL